MLEIPRNKTKLEPDSDYYLYTDQMHTARVELEWMGNNLAVHYAQRSQHDLLLCPATANAACSIPDVLTFCSILDQSVNAVPTPDYQRVLDTTCWHH